MKSALTIAYGIAILVLTGCATKPTGPKLFNSAYLVVKADGAITIPPDLTKDFVETIRSRSASITQAELASQGDMNSVNACGPGIMKVTQDITAISMSQNLSASRGFFFGSLKQETKQEVSISTSLKLEDCQSGKLLYSYDYAVNGNNPAELLKNLVAYNIYLAYQNQHQR